MIYDDMQDKEPVTEDIELFKSLKKLLSKQKKPNVIILNQVK